MDRKSSKMSRKKSSLFLVWGELKDDQELCMLMLQAVTLTPLVCLESQIGKR